MSMISLARGTPRLAQPQRAIASEWREILQIHFGEFAHAMLKGFPFIQPDHLVIQNCIATATRIRNAYRDRTHLINAEILGYSEYLAIGTNFRIFLEYVRGLDYTHPLRRAIFANLVSYTHAWITINGIFDLPCPFLGHEYVDFLYTVSRYVPTYLDNPQSRPWYLVEPQSEPGNAVFSIPYIPHRNDGVELTSILDYWHFDETTNISEIDQLVDLFESEIDVPGSTADCSKAISVLRTSLHFMRHHPLVNEAHVGKFCGHNYPGLHDDILQIADYCDFSYRDKIIEIFLDVFRLCGRHDFLDSPSMEDSIVNFLIRRDGGVVEIETPPPSYHRMSFLRELPTQHLRSKIRLIWDRDSTTLSHDDQHFHILTSFMRFISTSYNESDLEVIGIATGLLLVERHPDFIHGVRLLHNRATHAGFCKVVNCVAIQTLFDHSQMHDLSRAFATSSYAHVDFRHK